MTSKTIRVLAAIVVALALLIFVVENTDDSTSVSQEQPLLPGFSEHANDANRVRIFYPEADALTIRRESDKWLIEARDDYPADIGKLRPLIVALAGAGIVEEKTSNPNLYEKLGVDDPEQGGSGTKVSVQGDGFSYSVILGESAQGDHRYARIPDGEFSYLIDEDPDVPEAVGDWLTPEIVDIESQRIRKVSIVHEDGEAITVEKSTQDLTDFTVLDVPQGRELSYATVGNGIAGALSKLELDDVRKGIDGKPETSVVFETWDGLQLDATISSEDDESWVAFSATGDGEASTDRDDPAAEINDRLSGWQYRIPDYKKNLLTRRWDDILKSTETGESPN